MSSTGWSSAEIVRGDRQQQRAELTSNAILAWQQESDIEWRYIAPSKSMQNCLTESFNGRLRAECLDAYLFDTSTTAIAGSNVTNMEFTPYRIECLAKE